MFPLVLSEKDTHITEMYKYVYWGREKNMREMTIKEAAQALNVSTQTVRRRIERGEYKARKEVSELGQRWLIPASQIKAAVQDIAVVNVTRQVTLSELQDTIKSALDNMVIESLVKEVELVAAEAVTQAVQQETAALRRATEEQTGKLMEEIKSLKEQLAEAQSNTVEHYRLIDERLQQLAEARQQEQAQEQPRSFWQRLFG